MRKRAPLNKERLGTDYHYRAQVQLPDKLSWGVGYNCLFDFNKELAGQLRDALANAVQDRLVEHMRTLLAGSSEFRFFFKSWLKTNVAEDCRAEAMRWVNQNFKDVL